MKTIKKEYHIIAAKEKVWQALVNPKIIEKWRAGPVKMSDKEGFEFSLWGGDIHGKNVEVVNQEKLVQEWYAGDWPQPSIVTFDLTHKNGCTTVYLTHQDIPDDEYREIDEGWDEYYLGKIKKLLE